MLRWRLIGAAIILAPLVLLLGLDVNWNFSRPGIWLLPVGLLVVYLASGDLVQLFRSRTPQLPGWPVYLGNVVIVLLGCSPLLCEHYPADCPVGRLGLTLFGLLAAMAIAFADQLRRFREPGQAINELAITLFSYCYLAVPICFFMHLRTVAENRWGMVACVSVILIVKLADAGAYFAGKSLGGKLFGPRKMAPRLSPKKTWEGALGGLIAGCLGAWVALTFVPWVLGADPAPSRGWAILLYGGALTVAGLFGDLAESLLKRDADQKDSSTWLPGLGGMLDVIDSLLPTAPVAFLFWVMHLVGPAA